MSRIRLSGPPTIKGVLPVSVELLARAFERAQDDLNLTSWPVNAEVQCLLGPGQLLIAVLLDESCSVLQCDEGDDQRTEIRIWYHAKTEAALTHLITETARTVPELLSLPLRPREQLLPLGASASDDEVRVARPIWFPKRNETLLKWRKAYKIICKMRKEERDPDDWGDDTAPTLADYRDRLRATLKWGPSERTVSRIIQAGDKGWLR